MNEKQFLELSDIAFNEFIARVVFGLETYEFNGGFLYRDRTGSTPDYWFPTKIPDYKSWQGLGKGIEHANENGFDVELRTNVNRGDKRGEALITSVGKDGVSKQENMFLAFWISYMKALGVIGG